MSSNSNESEFVLVECSGPDYEDDIPDYSLNAYLGLIVPILGWIYVMLGLSFYYWKYRKTMSLRNRDFPLTLISIVALCYTFSVCIGNWTEWSRFPCVLFLSYNPFVFVFGLWPLIVRVVLFYNRVKFNRILAEKTFADYLENPDIKLIIDRKQSGASGVSDEGTKLRHFSNKKTVAISPKGDKGTSVDLPSYLTQAKFFSTTKFGLILVLVPGLIVIILFIVSTRDQQGCVLWSKRCGEDGVGPVAYYLITICIGFALLAVAVWAFWKVRHEPDPRRITNELTTAIIQLMFTVLMWFLLSFFDPGDMQGDGKFMWWILIIPLLCASITRLLMPAVYVYADSKKKSEANSFKSLDKILSSNIGRQLFKAHMVNELSIENYYFWREATEWRATYDIQNEGDRLRRFRFLVEYFVAPDGFMRINIKHAFHEDIMKVIKGELPLASSVFDNAIRSTFVLMAFDSLPRFEQTQIYKKQYLNSSEVSI